MWNYTADSDFLSVAISETGEYIVAGNDNGYLYLF